MTKKNILLTGAAGYIGSHTWCVLVQAGYNVVGIDNLSNSVIGVVDRIARIIDATPTFIRGDVRDTDLLDRILADYKIDAIVHFAALKAVGDSMLDPITYYDNNLIGLIQLVQSAKRNNIKNFIFSSSATVYGIPKTVPIREDFPLSATNPYGQTKLIGEQILRDIERSDCEWCIGYLRYFNPVGAHESGLIGDAPDGLPNNLMPYVAQVAVGKLEKVKVFGGDYETEDGTGVRDYIHVMDLAHGHVSALSYLLEKKESFTVNLGTGRGYSVLDVIRAYESASGRVVPYEVVARRPGDVAVCYADTLLAKEILGWVAVRELTEMCVDSWRWQSMNPSGFCDD
jgi:UDP-glucose 4-epimerase